MRPASTACWPAIAAPGRVLLVMLALALLAVGVACGSRTAASADGSSARAEAAQPAGGSAGAAAEAERERFARADWAPGQLEAHFRKHGAEGPYRTAAEYDAAARETIRRGTRFGYVDRESNAERIGFYDKANNRFTGLTRDGRRITTHFRPDRGEAYVRGLERSTYR